MKKRIISAIVMMIICIPLLIAGGVFFNASIFLLAMLALKEFLDIKETKKSIPLFIKVICYIFLIIIIATNVSTPLLEFKMDYRIISGLLLTLLLPTILYHDKDKYNIDDAFYLIGGLFFLSLSMTLLISVRSESILKLIYLLSITVITDTFAYVSGMLIGRHKLLEVISPNKTWEGTIWGTILGTFVSTMFYITVVNPNISIFYIMGISFFLSILGQFGDLFFSSIKRYYDKKDFSNLIPGHGGILDRIDSIIFVLLGFMFFITII